MCSSDLYNPKGEKLDINVQVDINIGSLDWLRFSYHSNVYQGNVKGLHRTQLMLSLFANKGKTFGHSTAYPIQTDDAFVFQPYDRELCGLRR